MIPPLEDGLRMAGAGLTATAEQPSPLLQLSTHADLAESSRTPGTLTSVGLDAIIVPAARAARNLRTAIGLAEQTAAVLIVLCSYATEANEVGKLLAERGLATHSAAVPMPRRSSRWPLAGFETTRWVRRPSGKLVCAGRDSDLSMKRNTGLLLAKMLGWKHIFFLDDDIRGIASDTLRDTVALLGRGGAGYRTSGMSVQSFPDNSVVCHALRETGDFQDVFVSGSVLAVNCEEPFDFFPDIYNEDWLFFYRDAAARRLATSGSSVAQLPYDPFANPMRAAQQEFGDVLAEGLYALLHSVRTAEAALAAAGAAYWERFLADRSRVLARVGKRLANPKPGAELPARQREAIANLGLTAYDLFPQPFEPDALVERDGGGVARIDPEQELPDARVPPVLQGEEVPQQPLADAPPAQAGRDPD